MRRLVLLVAGLALPALAQTAHVRVEAAAGRVLVDDQPAGTVATWIPVEPGAHEIALVDDAQAWDPRRVEALVTLADGDSTILRLTLPERVRVETLPIRATVVRLGVGGERDTLGMAPLTLDLAPGASAELVVSLDGYLDARQSVEAGDGAVTVLLQPGPDAPRQIALLPTQRSSLQRTLIDAGLGAAILAAGAVAVHYKFRADDVDDRYRDPDSADYGDEALRQEALRLDRYSVTALGVMQVGVGVLALRFVLR